MIGYLLRYDKFMRFLIEGKIEGWRKRRMTKMAFSQQIKDVKMSNYREVDELAMDRK